MDDPDGDYAPQSPDLSAYHSSSSYSQPHQPSQSGYYPQQQGYHHQQQQQRSAFQTPNDFSDPFAYGNNQIPPSSYHQQQAMMAHNNKGYGIKSEMEDPDWMPEGAAPMKAGRKGKGAKAKAVDDDCGKAAPGVEEGINVTTKFPVARIKRIMQADEDIGKVAQVTPTAVSKALELFMISVITKAANEAKSKSSKRVTAAHLKQAVEKDDQLDFLQDIISKVPDAPAPKKEEDSEDAHEGKRKKSGGGGSRRKKTKEDSDF